MYCTVIVLNFMHHFVPHTEFKIVLNFVTHSIRSVTIGEVLCTQNSASHDTINDISAQNGVRCLTRYDRRQSTQYFVLNFVHRSRSASLCVTRYDRHYSAQDGASHTSIGHSIGDHGAYVLCKLVLKKLTIFFLTMHLVKAFPRRKIAGKTVFHSSTVFHFSTHHLREHHCAHPLIFTPWGAHSASSTIWWSTSEAADESITQKRRRRKTTNGRVHFQLHPHFPIAPPPGGKY